MARSYRSKHPHYLRFAASFERDVLRSLGVTHADTFSEATSRYRYYPHWQLDVGNRRPLSRAVLATELRRRGWPAKRARAAAYLSSYWERSTKDERRTYHRALRHRTRQLLYSYPGLEPLPEPSHAYDVCCMTVCDWVPAYTRRAALETSSMPL